MSAIKHIVGYRYKGENFTPLGMREQAILLGLLQPYARNNGIYDSLRSVGLSNDFDMDAPETYTSDEWPKSIYSDVEETPEDFIGMHDSRFQRHEFVLRIRCVGAAFGEGEEYEYDRAQEVNRLLHEVALAVGLDGLTEGRLFDDNGAACGSFRFEPMGDKQ